MENDAEAFLHIVFWGLSGSCFVLGFSTRRSRNLVGLGVRQGMTGRRGGLAYAIENRPRFLALAGFSRRPLPGHACVTSKVLTRTPAMLAPPGPRVNDSQRQVVSQFESQIASLPETHARHSEARLFLNLSSCVDWGVRV